MKKITTLIATFALLSFFAALPSRAVVLFQDGLNYSDGLIETDGWWYAYSPATPHGDAFVTNDLLILNQINYDAVAAPSTNFVNSTGGSILYASFTINVSTLPTGNGGYFCIFKDHTNDYVSHIFINARGTVVPGTYRLGISDFATSIAAAGATNFPMDLATDITYQVVFSYDTNSSSPTAGGTLWINPASESDYSVFANDTTTSSNLLNIIISQIGFSQYANQGVAAIGNVIVGTTFSDVQTNTPEIPVIGITPQSTNIYSGNNLTLYVAASGLGQLSYQWLSNSVPLSDGANVSGSVSNVLALTDLQNTANYSVIVANSAGSVTSAVAVVTVDTTPTPPFFTTQPYGTTNGLGSTITLTALANGTGPLTYQWYSEPTNGGGFSPVSGQTSSTLTLVNANFQESGYYYVTATGGDGSSNSVTVTVLVVPPATVTIGYLHSLLTNNPPDGILDLNGTTVYSVEGVVTSFGGLISHTYSEYFIQDGTGGALVFVNGTGNTNVPPAGALVLVTGQAQQYYGELEIVPNVTTSSNSIAVVSYGNPLPAPTALNLPLMATNTMGTYGLNVQCSLVTITNAYLYSSSSGAAVSGTFPVNGTTSLYAFAQPYSAGQPYMVVYVFTYTNLLNNSFTNFWGQPIPSYVYQVTGAMAVYSPTQPEVYPSRYADFVTTAPAPFAAGLTESNGVGTLTWPAVTGSTYSVYSAASLLGPWTQTFGLSYYPSTGIYTATNAAARQFYKVSTP